MSIYHQSTPPSAWHKRITGTLCCLLLLIWLIQAAGNIAIHIKQEHGNQLSALQRVLWVKGDTHGHKDFHSEHRLTESNENGSVNFVTARLTTQMLHKKYILRYIIDEKVVHSVRHHVAVTSDVFMSVNCLMNFGVSNLEL